MRSIRVKITAITILAILASLVAFACVSFLTVGQEASRSSAEKMHLLSESAKKSIDAYLTSIEGSVMTASRFATASLDGLELVEYAANEAPDDRTPEQQRALDVYIGAHSSYMQEVFGDIANYTAGSVTYHYTINPELSVEERGFYFSRMGKVGFERRGDFDIRELDKEDPEYAAWYHAPIDRGTPLWLGPYEAHLLDGTFVESYLTPIYKSGTLIGVLGMDILFDTMVDQIDDLEVYRTGYACLLDREGRVIYHPELEFGEVPTFAEEVLNQGGFGRKDSGNDILRYEKGGQTWQLSFSTLVNGTKLVVAAPVREVVASWYRLLESIPFIALAIVLVFAGLSFLAMRTVSKPLQQLTGVAHRLSQGDYDVELDMKEKNDEVGELTSAFRRLIDHLRIYTSNLNSHVYVDDLTGTKNAVAYAIAAARLNDSIAGSETEEDLRIALVIIRCLNLAEVNETYGHDRGDALLRHTAQLICHVFDGGSTVFRMEGEEFMVILSGRDYANRNELLLDFDIRKDMGNRRATDPWLRIEVAKGMTTLRPDEDKNMDELVVRARQRMEEDQAQLLG